jgi:hypothetical protein
MYDLLAEELWTIRTQNLPAQKTGFEIVRLLTAAPNAARYRTVLDGIDRYIDKNGTGDLVGHYARIHKNEVAEQYLPGTLNLAALRRAFTTDALDARPSMAQAQALAALPANTTMEDLLARAGKPAAVVSRGVVVYQGAVQQERELWFNYRGIGGVSFEWQRESGWRLERVVLDPMAFELAMPYRDQAAALGMPDDTRLLMILLASGNPASIKSSSMETYRRAIVSREYLDTAAELLLRQVKNPEEGATDAYGWLCNLLIHYGGLRYVNVLATVELQSTDAKLQRYAARIVRSGTDMSGTPYEPGSVSLTEQANKYPSLYPEITLVRGMW